MGSADMGEGGQKGHTCSYTVTKSWDVQHVTIVNNTVLYI